MNTPRRRGPGRAPSVGSIFVLVLALALGLFGVARRLWVSARMGEGIGTWDVPTLEWMVAHRTPVATNVAWFFSTLGSAWGMTTIALLATGLSGLADPQLLAGAADRIHRGGLGCLDRAAEKPDRPSASAAGPGRRASAHVVCLPQRPHAQCHRDSRGRRLPAFPCPAEPACPHLESGCLGNLRLGHWMEPHLSGTPLADGRASRVVDRRRLGGNRHRRCTILWC